MFVSDDIISFPRFLNPRKPWSKKLTSRKESKMRKILPPRIKNTDLVYTVKQEITDENGML